MKRVSTKRPGLAALAGIGLLAACASNPPAADDRAGLDLYIVRHAQTMANVTKVYSPKNQRTFSKQGEEEIDALLHKLDGLHLDRILVSPTYRTLRTIAPYLRREGRIAEIWPELEECCWQPDRDSPASKRIPRGDPIRIDADLAGLVRFRSPETRFWYNAQNYADSERQVEEAAALVRQRFSRTGRSVLIVSHFHTGAWLIADLLGDPAAQKLALRTGALTQLRQDGDGRFRIVTLNDAPFAGVY